MNATIDDVKRLRELIKDDWSLCQLFEGKPRAKEAEVMGAQTIHAAVINANANGNPFSFKGEGVESVQGGHRASGGWARTQHPLGDCGIQGPGVAKLTDW